MVVNDIILVLDTHIAIKHNVQYEQIEHWGPGANRISSS